MKDILLVEDNRHILDGNRYFLEKAGYTCAAAETIAGAKKIIGEETPRLMILDRPSLGAPRLDQPGVLRDAGAYPDRSREQS